MFTVLTVFISCTCISVFATIQVSSVFILVNFMTWCVRFRVSMFQTFRFILKVSSFCLPVRLLPLLSWLPSSVSPVKFLLHCWLCVQTGPKPVWLGYCQQLLLLPLLIPLRIIITTMMIIKSIIIILPSRNPHTLSAPCPHHTTPDNGRPSLLLILLLPMEIAPSLLNWPFHSGQNRLFAKVNLKNTVFLLFLFLSVKQVNRLWSMRSLKTLDLCHNHNRSS